MVRRRQMNEDLYDKRYTMKQLQKINTVINNIKYNDALDIITDLYHVRDILETILYFKNNNISLPEDVSDAFIDDFITEVGSIASTVNGAIKYIDSAKNMIEYFDRNGEFESLQSI